MEISISYKDTLFKRDNLNPIRDVTTFKPLHKLWNEIKANSKPVYSNIGGGSHDQLSLMLTNARYALIFNTPFV